MSEEHIERSAHRAGLRRLQFSLQNILLLVTFICVALGIYYVPIFRARQQEAARVAYQEKWFSLGSINEDAWSDATVTTLDFEGYNPTRLPPQAWQLRNLQELNLTCFPPLDSHDVKDSTLSPKIGELTKLKRLFLQSNDIPLLPPEIGKLSNLRELYLWSNGCRLVPPEIGNLSQLTELSIFDNKLDTVPPEIGQLTRLTHLSLETNHLKTLPPEIWQLTTLEKLNLNDNRLTTVSSKIGNLTNLKQLQLNNNQLLALPSEIGNLQKLTHLYLNNNQFGKLPSEITKLTNLQVLTVSDVTDLLPEIGRLKKLQEMSITEKAPTSEELKYLESTLPQCEIDLSMIQRQDESATDDASSVAGR